MLVITIAIVIARNIVHCTHALQTVSDILIGMAQSSSSSSGTVTPASGKSTLAHQKCGVGYGARFSIQEKDLPSGWRCEKRSPKYTLWYDDKGTKVEVKQ